MFSTYLGVVWSAGGRLGGLKNDEVSVRWVQTLKLLLSKTKTKGKTIGFLNASHLELLFQRGSRTISAWILYLCSVQTLLFRRAPRANGVF